MAFKRHIYRDIEQGTDEWLELRVGRLTSSKLGEFIYTKGKDKYGLGAKMIPKVNEVAAEIHTGISDSGGYTSAKMDRGSELEFFVRERYSEDNFVTVEEVGFATYGRYIGDSPDGLIGKDGCLEIKCRMLYLHFAILKAKLEGKEVKIPAKDQAQCDWHMFVCDRKWCDYISYHPEFPEDQQMLVTRMYMSPEKLAILEVKAIAIENYIDDSLKLCAA